jgi:hypothetical protein
MKRNGLNEYLSKDFRRFEFLNKVPVQEFEASIWEVLIHQVFKVP